MKSKRLFFLLCSVGLSFSASATDYYVSAAGNDALDGKSQANAWKTITKVNGVSFSPGDRIFFRRGDTFRGQVRPMTSGTSGSPITFAAYGTSTTAPIISGAVQLNGTWTLDAGSVWKYNTSAYSSVSQVFVSGNKKFTSRFPNTGFFFVSTKISSSSFTSSDPAISSKPASYYTNSSIAMRAKEWYWQNRLVSSVSGSTVTTTTAIPDEPDPNEGFYFYGSRGMIDVEGEWSYDNATKTLYYQSSSATVSPASVLEASVYNYGFDLSSRNYITIKELTIEKQGLSGVYLNLSSNNTFSFLTIRNCGNDAITTYWWQSSDGTPKSNYNTVNNCTISDCNYNGIFIQHANNWNINTNTISRIGTQFPGYFPGYSGYPNNNIQNGIIVGYLAAYNTIANNTIDNIAKCGVQIVGPNNIIEKNIIGNFGKTYADLGGIYLTTSYSHHNTVRHNFCFNGSSYTGAWNKFTTWDPNLSTAAKRAAGLYGDETPSNNLWQNNTAWNNDFTGLQTVKGVNEKYFGNITFKNGDGKNEFQLVSWGAGIQVKRNTFYSRATSTAYGFWGTSSNLLASVDSNRYINPYKGTLWIADFAGTKKNLTEWNAIYPGDTHSKTSYFSSAAGGTDGAQLFTNMSNITKSFPLTGTGTWYDLDGNVITGGSISVGPWYSAIAVFQPSGSLAAINPNLLALKLNEAFNAGTSLKVYPNPVSKQATIAFCTKSDEAKVLVDVYNTIGGKVKRLYDGRTNAGQTYNLELTTGSLLPGIYLVRLTTSGEAENFKIIVN